MYSEQLLDHFQRPRNVGELERPAITVEVENPACGDLMRLSVRLEGGRVVAARYQTRGCTASVAAGSALTEIIHGKSVSELSSLDSAAVVEGVGGLIPEARHAAVLCIDAVQAVLREVKSRC